MLNGEERFVVMAITRNDIAAMLNDVIDEKELPIPFFGEGDPRLPSRLCGELVDSLSTVYGGGFSEEDLGYEERAVVLAFLTTHFN